MKVECNRCGGKATINSSTRESENVKKLYCSCNNPECGHSFVVDLAFSHTLSPSALDIPDEVLTQLKRASRIEQRRIFSGLAPTG